jgi:predicted NAD/FAD-dependent oxidoreductase
VNALARIVTDGSVLRAVDVRGERFETTTVIAAVPWFALRTLFGTEPPAKLSPILAAAAAMESMPIVTVNLWYDRAVMHEAFVGLPGREMQWVFDKRTAFGGQASHLSLVSSGATRLAALGSDELTSIAVREVADALPLARGATLLRATVVREKQATFSLAEGQPRRPGEATPVDGLYLAGDWTDTGLPGTIESAVVSGHRAAKLVMAARGPFHP